MTKEGFNNSEGWIPNPPILIQRLAPFTSSPTIKVAKTKIIAKIKTIIPNLRTCSGLIIEIESRIITAGIRKIICLWTK